MAKASFSVLEYLRFKLLTGQGKSRQAYCDDWKAPLGSEVTIKYVCIVVERRSLVNLYRISMQEDSY